MAFTASDVKDLREKTGCGMMDCKKALTEADGDMDKAIEILREKGMAKAVKKSGRIAAEGLVDIVVENGVGAIIEVNSETDFVAKNEEFVNMVKDFAKQVIKENPADVDALLASTIDGTTVKDILTEKIAKIGENMNVVNNIAFETSKSSYIHVFTDFSNFFC